MAVRAGEAGILGVVLLVGMDEVGVDRAPAKVKSTHIGEKYPHRFSMEEPWC